MGGDWGSDLPCLGDWGGDLGGVLGIWGDLGGDLSSMGPLARWGLSAMNPPIGPLSAVASGAHHHHGPNPPNPIRIIKHHKRSVETTWNHSQPHMCYLIWSPVGNTKVLPDRKSWEIIRNYMESHAIRGNQPLILNVMAAAAWLSSKRCPVNAT